MKGHNIENLQSNLASDHVHVYCIRENQNIRTFEMQSKYNDFFGLTFEGSLIQLVYFNSPPLQKTGFGELLFTKGVIISWEISTLGECFFTSLL